MTCSTQWVLHSDWVWSWIWRLALNFNTWLNDSVCWPWEGLAGTRDGNATCFQITMCNLAIYNNEQWVSESTNPELSICIKCCRSSWCYSTDDVIIVHRQLNNPLVSAHTHTHTHTHTHKLECFWQLITSLYSMVVKHVMCQVSKFCLE